MEIVDFKSISKKLRELRIEKGYTQEYIAIQAKVNTSHISNIETNKAKISLQTLLLVCNALDTTLDYIVGNIYTDKKSAIDQEILKEVHTKDEATQETILKIIKLL